MILNNFITITEKYIGASKFAFWKELQPEDIVEIRVKLQPVGRNGNSLYSTNVNFIGKNSSFTCSMTEASNYLAKIRYVENGTEDSRKDRTS